MAGIQADQKLPFCYFPMEMDLCSTEGTQKMIVCFLIKRIIPLNSRAGYSLEMHIFLPGEESYPARGITSSTV